MKILEKKYPKGTFKGQKTDGRYIDGYLYSNLELLADKIIKDMTFLGICFSSTLEVGAGKSVLCTQLGEAWTDIMNRKYRFNLKFTAENIVWRPEELIEKAFKVPKYSFLLLDEWEDATYWSQLGKSLRTFFRKCRQLNLFIMVIIPNFFQLPVSYAISRSAFAIDVKFEEGFARGYFDFYGFDEKRKLYIKGKKEHNYKVVAPNFFGRFLDGYGISEKEYRAAKLKDMLRYEEEEPSKPSIHQIKVELFKKVWENLKNIEEMTQKRLAQAFGVTSKTAYVWLHEDFSKKKSTVEVTEELIRSFNPNKEKEIIWDEEKFLEEEKEEQINNK